MNRRLAIRNAIAALAVALLPKVLRPQETDMISDKLIYCKGMNYYIDNYDAPIHHTIGSFTTEDLNQLIVNNKCNIVANKQNSILYGKDKKI